MDFLVKKADRVDTDPGRHLQRREHRHPVRCELVIYLLAARVGRIS